MYEQALRPIPLTEIEAAHEQIGDVALRTPLIHLPIEDASVDIYLKLENMQPIGSFKIRGASNAMSLLSKGQLRYGVTTASMGNMAQGVAWNARRLGIPCLVVVPDNAPEAKLSAIHALGAKIKRIPFVDWWQILLSGECPDAVGLFIHPVCDSSVIAGHGVIGLELLEDLPDLDAVLIPFGGGGLTLGIASAIKSLRPATSIFAVEPATANPLTRSWAKGFREKAPYEPSFVDGCGGASVLPQMWSALQLVLDGAIDVTLAETADAIRLLVAQARVVAEGAGAVSVAAALSGKVRGDKIACIVSGGNINRETLVSILLGELPGS